MGHFLLRRFAFQEADPDLTLLALLLTRHSPLLWVQPEQVQVYIMSLPRKSSLGLKFLSISEAAISFQKS